MALRVRVGHELLRVYTDVPHLGEGEVELELVSVLRPVPYRQYDTLHIDKRIRLFSKSKVGGNIQRERFLSVGDYNQV